MIEIGWFLKSPNLFSKRTKMAYQTLTEWAVWGVLLQ